MRTKTVVANTHEDFDAVIAEQDAKLNVKFTQTHVSTHPVSGKPRYIAVLFYDGVRA